MHIEIKASLQLDELKQAVSLIPSISTNKTSFDVDFVERLLGRRQGKNLTRSTSRRLKRISSHILPSIKPRITYEIFPIKSTDGGLVTLTNGLQFKSRKMSRSIQGASWLVCSIATISPEIDHRINALMEQGKMADAYVADTIGSGAIEHIADGFHKGFEKKIIKSGPSVSLRFSPGYCDWPVTDQEKLFSLLDNESVGVELGNTFLMSPRKSISAVFAVFDAFNAVIKNPHHNPCRSCWKKDCIARRVDAVTPSH